MPALIGSLQPGEQRRLRNRALIRWRQTASPATRLLVDSHGVTSVLRETAEGVYAEVTAADGSILARYRVTVHAGRGSLRTEDLTRGSSACRSHVHARSAALRTRSADLAGRSSLLRAVSAALRTTIAGPGIPMR